MEYCPRIKELYKYRSVLKSLVVRDIRGRYRNSRLKTLWQFINPIVNILLFYIVMNNILIVGISEYWVYISVGIFPFTFLQNNLVVGSGCIAANGGYINKMYFPREIIVLAQVTGTFIIWAISYVALIAIMWIIGYPIIIMTYLWLIPYIFLTFIFSLGLTFILATVVVFCRDIQHLIDAFSRVLFWFTPMVYIPNQVNSLLEKIIWLNPLTYYTESFHEIMYWGTTPTPNRLLICVLLSGIIVIFGVIVFEKYKDRFAERI